MPEEYIECPELCGKIIEKIRIYKATPEGVEMQIDLSDETSFACSFCIKPLFEASLIRSGEGMPEVIQTYELD